MRASITACLLGMLGALGGGALIGRWCLGLMLIILSGLAISYGLLREAPAARPSVHPVGLHDVLERARRAG